MKIWPGEREEEVILDFSDLAEFESFFNQADQQGYFLLQTESLRANAVFRARCSDSPRTRRIRPVSIARTGSGYEIRLTSAPSAAGAQPAASAPGDAAPREGSPLDQQLAEPSQSLNDKIRAMSVSDRVLLAQKADLMERRILMKENNSKINEFLLRNVRITDHEIAFLARNPASPMQTILAIANRKEWMNREVIRGAILTNPRTPPHMVLDLLPSASSQEIMKMFHSKHLREDVASAVKQEMKRRGLRPPKKTSD